jgi:hypothetical protein
MAENQKDLDGLPYKPICQAVTGQTMFMIHIFWRCAQAISKAMMSAKILCRITDTAETITSQPGTVVMSIEPPSHTSGARSSNTKPLTFCRVLGDYFATSLAVFVAFTRRRLS